MQNAIAAYENPSKKSPVIPLRQAVEMEMSKSRKSRSSPLGRVMGYWKGNPKMRIAVGLGLLSWGMVATVAGAFATAGIILGARAGISALGAFTSGKGLYELIQSRKTGSDVERLMAAAATGTESTEAMERLIRGIEERFGSNEIQTQLDACRKKRRTSAIVGNVIGITAAGVAGILGLQWGIEALGNSLWPVSEIPSETLSAETLSAESVRDIQKFDTNAIADDIRHDHPKQGWVTLEQMIRRVEGLKSGIGLEQSEKLNAMNASVTKMVHDPDGAVGQLFKNRGYDLSRGIDAASRRLGENDIKEIVGEYVRMTIPEKTLPGNIAMSAIAPQAGSASIPLAMDTPNDWTAAAKGVGGTLACSAWYAAYRLWKSKEEERKSKAGVPSKTPVPTETSILSKTEALLETQPIFVPDRQTTDAEGHNAPTPVPKPESTPPKAATSETMKPTDVPPSGTTPSGTMPPRTPPSGTTPSRTPPSSNPPSDPRKTMPSANVEPQSGYLFRMPESALRAQKKIHAYFTENFHWESDEQQGKTTPEKRVDSYHGTTLGWQYRAYVEYFASHTNITIVWYDHDAARSHVRSDDIPYGSLLNPADPEKWMEFRLDELFFEMLVQREKMKSDDMKHIRAVQIPRSHLKMIYDQMEQPEILGPNNEVLGFWLASAYEIRDSVLPMRTMDNPPLSDQEFTTGYCRLKDLPTGLEYYFMHPQNMIFEKFPKKEAKMILRERIREMTPPRMGIVFTGAYRLINWHKHPDYIDHPSWGDIREAMRDIDMQFPGLETHPYTIALRIREDEIASLSKDPKVCVLPKSVYWGQYSYAFRTFNLIYVKKKFEGLRQLEIRIT